CHNGGADHAVARDEAGELRLGPATRALGPHRQHDVAQVGGRVVYTYLDILRQFDAEVGEHAAWVNDGAGTIGQALVPGRRDAQQHLGVTGAQRAHDDVVHFGCVLDRAELGERADVDPQLTQGGARILEQAPLEAGVDPGPGNHLGTERGGPAVHEVDLGRDLLRGEHALLDQQ